VAIVSVRPQVLASLARGPASADPELLNTLREGGATPFVFIPNAQVDARPPATQAQVPSTRVVWPLLSLIVVVGAGVAIAVGMKDANYLVPAAAVSGVSLFAGIYAGAQVIERLLEPLSHWLLSTQGDESKYAAAVGAADTAVTTWQTDPTPATKKAAEDEMLAMATAKKKIDEMKDDRAAVYWAIASVAGMLASGFMHIYLLKLIGITTTHAWDVFATGLIVGSGTKPVHDLVTKLSASSSSAGDSGGTTTSLASGS
jgi:hypothetical protein